MTEPTGDPAAAPQPAAADPATPLEPGWYPDPEGGAGQAFWNGTTWHRPSGQTTARATEPTRSGRPGWLVPVVATVVVALLVAVVVGVVASRRSGSGVAAGSGGGSSAEAAGPQATGPRVGTNGVTVVLPDGWVDVPLDSAAFSAFVDGIRKDSPDLATQLEKLQSTDAAALSVLALTKASDGTYKTNATVLVDKSAVTSATTLASAVTDKLSAAVHDVSVTTGRIAGHDAVFATYDQVSALVPPQGGQVYVLGPDSVAIVTVTTYDTVNPLALAKQIAATVSFG